MNKFRTTDHFHYAPLQEDHIPQCLDLAGQWCQLHRCQEDLNLMGEWEAVHTALKNFSALNLQGGVSVVDGQVQAFALGELLNEQTAVVHIEKADSHIRGLYAVINQQFCQHAWSDRTYINREQDLGEPGLSQVKLAYHPCRLVKKYRVKFA